MVTASASGLDPDISPKAAYAQVQRVAQARGLSPESVMALVNANTEGPLLGLFGPEKVNVLKLNIALEKAEKEGRVVNAASDLPKAFVLREKRDGTSAVYLSQLSSATLKGRMESDGF